MSVATTTPTPARPVAVIEPTAGAVLPRLREVWTDRELLYFLALRDIKVRYAQTILGWLWAILQPLGLMLVFLFAFRTLGNVKTDGVPYALYVFAGLAFWTFFSRAVVTGADSLALNAPLVTKTAAPRLLIPLASVAGALVDLLITMAILVVFVAAYGHPLTVRLLALPAVVLLGFLLACGIATALSAVNVRHRDIRNALPFATQLLLFLSPIAYSLKSLGGLYAGLLSVNPLVGVVEAFRWCWLATPPPSLRSILIAVGITALILVVGLRYFSRVARHFADVA